jgi:hypothetical protein
MMFRVIPSVVLLAGAAYGSVLHPCRGQAGETPDRTKMTVTLRLEGGAMLPISLKRVYEPWEKKEGPAASTKPPEGQP